MSTCPSCNRHTEYTTYIRSVRRNERTHHNKQSWLPVGFVCVFCEHFTFTMEPAQKQITLSRLARRPGNAAEPDYETPAT